MGVRSRLITQVAIVPGGGHDHVTVHIAGKCVGTLVVGAGEGKALADLLLRAEDEAESWLVKDFNVLYRATQRFSEACHGRGQNGEGPYPAQQDLDMQLARLRPAYEMTEGVRVEARAGTPDPRGWTERGLGLLGAIEAAHEATKKAGEGD